METLSTVTNLLGAENTFALRKATAKLLQIVAPESPGKSFG